MFANRGFAKYVVKALALFIKFFNKIQLFVNVYLFQHFGWEGRVTDVPYALRTSLVCLS